MEVVKRGRLSKILILVFVFGLVVLVGVVFREQIYNFLGFYKIARVIDGDTFEDENKRVFRLKGVDCPEPREHECFALEAKEFARLRLEGRRVRLENVGFDSFNRILTHVILGQTTLEEELLKEGLARVEFPVEEKYKVKFESAHRGAQNQKLGLWGNCPYPQSPTTTPTDPKCVIKGNYNPKTKERFYHLPSCPNYQTTLIGNEAYERFFCSEEEAKEAGFVLSSDCR